MSKKRYNIGLFVCHLENEFSSSLSKGAIIAAQELDSNLIIFPGRYINGVYNDEIRTEFEYQYNTIFNYASSSNMDALLVMTGTIGGFITKEQMKDILDTYKNLPIITIASEIDGYQHIMFNNATGLKDGIEHFIKHHNRKRIAFVCGPKTNEDSQQRLQVYLDTLKENNIEIDENLITYGNFSEFCVDIIEKLFKNNDNNIDAIVFANDKMAIGGYTAINKMGFKIGEDLSVMGFDDSSAAIALVPSLTSVKADAAELGYEAVIQAIELLEKGKCENKIVDTKLVLRNSCGCNSVKSEEINDLSGFKNITKMNSEDTAKVINSYIFEDFMSSMYSEKTKHLMYDFSLSVLNYARDIYKDSKIETELLEKFTKLLSVNVFDNIPFEKFRNALDAIYYKVYNSIEKEERSSFTEAYNWFYKSITNASIIDRTEYKNKVTNIAWISSSITRDLVQLHNDETNKFGDIMDKLMRLYINNSYIYVFKEPFAYYNGDRWETPENVYLKAFHDHNKIVVPEESEQEIKTLEMFSNKFINKEIRHTMVVVPLISQQDHFGVLICELEHENFCFLSSISVQICAALKIISLLSDLKNTQKKLEESLNEIRSNNIILNKISRSDELTGIYNRRGFFESAKNLLSNPMNEGKQAVLLFGDMDGLKVINDVFGHDEGDYALKKVAYILKESFRSTDIFGRIGGDEFSAFAIVKEEGFAHRIRGRINEISKKLNDITGKPYFINISLGIVEFTCTKNTNFQQLLDEADMLLYKDKKNKNKVILRDEIK